jgi:hypothetical protein
MPSFIPSQMKNRMLLRKQSAVGGSILLSKGGPGVGSSYDSVEEYKKITGTGMLGNKLRSLIVKPVGAPMKKNIRFDI